MTHLYIFTLYFPTGRSIDRGSVQTWPRWFWWTGGPFWSASSVWVFYYAERRRRSQMFLSSDKKEFSVLNVHRKTSRSPVNHLWLLLSGLLAFSEVLQVGVHFSVLQTRGGWRCSIVCKEAQLPSQSRRTNASHAGELSFNWSEKQIQILTTRLLTSPSRRNTLSSRSLMDRSLSWMTVREFCSCTVNKANRQTTSNTQEKPEAANDDEFFLFSPHVSSWLHSCTSNTLYVSASSKSESRW